MTSRSPLFGLLIALWALLAGCGGASYEAAKSAAPGAPGVAGVYGRMAPPAAAAMEAPTESDVDVHRGEMPPGPAAFDSRTAQAAPPPAKPLPAPSGVETTPPVPDPSVPDTGEQKIAGPLLIYTARLQMAVFETQRAIDRTEKLAREAGGYLVKRDDRSITVRVPAKAFQATLEALASDGDELHREVSVQDVTEQFFDLKVRLKNAYAVRDRIQKLLDTARNVQEALAVERELERIAGEIERFEGKLKLLRELIAFSTITVQYEPRPTDQVGSNVRLPFPWLDQLGLGNLMSL
jgi:hypothetical protein